MPSMTPTDYRQLLPVDVANEVIGRAVEESVVMAACRQAGTLVRMPSSAMSIPVATTTPVAKFVNQFGSTINPADVTARKPYDEIQWDNAMAVAEEIAVTTALPNAFVEDATFDVWGNVRDRLTTSLAHVFDLAAINGTGAPANYPTGGIAAVTDTMADAGLLGITSAWASVAGKGGIVSSGIGGPTGNAGLFGMVDDSGRPLYLTSLSAGAPSGLLGVPLYVTSVWPLSPNTDFIVGDFHYAVVGVRQDITWDMSREGVITDAAGVVKVNAFQDDMTIIRMYARLAFALPGGATASPFAGIRIIPAAGP